MDGPRTGGPAHDGETPSHGEAPAWQPDRVRLRPLRLLVSWVITAAALWVTAAILPGVHISDAGGAFVIAVVVGALNAVLPPVLAALKLPLTLVVGFLLTLAANAFVLWFAADLLASFDVDSYWSALSAAILVAAVSIVL